MRSDIQRRAAENDERFVTVGPLAVFSTDTGDAWLLDPADHLASRVARAGDAEYIHLEENDATFRDRVVGYPVNRIRELG